MRDDVAVLVGGVVDPEELRNFLARLEPAGNRIRATTPLVIVAGGDPDTGFDFTAAVRERPVNVRHVTRATGSTFARQINAALNDVPAELLVLATSAHIGGIESIASAVETLVDDPESAAALVQPSLAHAPGGSIATAPPLSRASWQRRTTVLGLSPGLMVVRRDALIALGALDEEYATEVANLDLALRFLARGWPLVAAQVSGPVRQRPHVSAHARDLDRLRHRWALPVSHVRAMRTAFDIDILSRPTWGQRRLARARGAAQNVRRGHALSTTYLERTETEWRDLAENPGTQVPHGDGPDVLYLLPDIVPYGGVISVLQLVNRLCRRGVDAAVATFGRIDLPDSDEVMLHRPIVVTGRTNLMEQIGAPKLIVTTSWDTVYDALLLRDHWGSRIVSFVQDYEADFYPGTRPARAAAQLSLELVHDKIVKTQWLASRLAKVPGRTHLVPLGLNLDVFYAPPRPPQGLTVACAARPGVRVRNHAGTVAILHEAAKRLPGMEITFFGSPHRLGHLPARHLGPMSQRGVAGLLRTSSALIDASLFQAFGRPGLEAMASGVPSVLTRYGGINEYAVNNRNCLQIDPTSIHDGADAIVRVLTDDDFRVRLRAAGLATAKQYDAEREADRTRTLFDELLSDHQLGTNS